MSKRIVSLRAENVKRLKAVHIKPTGDIVTVCGRNGQGKSSTLDSISMALGGGAEMCARPIREGEKSAVVVLDLGDIIVTRKWTAKGTYLTITGSDGAKFASPQQVLAGLTGKISFDPLSFTRLDPKKQLEVLRELVGIDFTELDAKRKQTFDERTDKNREAKKLKARLEALPEVEAVESVSVAELSVKLKEAEAHNRNVESIYARVKNEAFALAAIDENIKAAMAELAQLKSDREDLVTKIDEVTSEAAAVEVVDTAPIFDAIEAVEATNEAARQNERRAEVADELKATEQMSHDLTAKLAEIDDEKEATLAIAAFPVAGLSFDEDGVTFGGLPFGQASGAEQLRVSAAIGIAMNPELRVLLIRDGSLLDADSMKLLAEMAAAHDAQIWVERVGTDQACSVVIEDGEVLE